MTVVIAYYFYYCCVVAVIYYYCNFSLPLLGNLSRSWQPDHLPLHQTLPLRAGNLLAPVRDSSPFKYLFIVDNGAGFLDRNGVINPCFPVLSMFYSCKINIKPRNEILSSGAVWSGRGRGEEKRCGKPCGDAGFRNSLGARGRVLCPRRRQKERPCLCLVTGRIDEKGRGAKGGHQDW